MKRRTKPEPIPPRETESETKLCEEPKMAVIKREIERCNELCILEAYRNGLCFHHYKISQGFVFNEKHRRYIKEKNK